MILNFWPGGICISRLPSRPPADHRQPFSLDRARFRPAHRRGWRELIEPGIGSARIDDQLGVRGDAAVLVGLGYARIEPRAPAVADDIDRLGGLRARRDRPH